MTAPSGNVFDFKFRSTGGRHDDDCSRVTQINDGATLLVLYEYLGESTVVDKDYSGIDVLQRRYGTSSGSYPAFDRFNRIVEDTWTKDLATDVDIYHVDITYDRNSNITELDEVDVHVGFDAKITVDGLDRVSNVQEGTLSGGSITSETREQTWTLMDQVGNWEHVKLDLDGDGSYGGTDEYDDDRTHNEVNELTGRDTDDNGSDDHTLVYDEAGNLPDDGESYKYDYDVWYRLRKVNKQSDALLAEHRYNGLGHRIAEHTDTDVDGDVDANDDWHHFAYDERWRVVAMFLDADTSPTEEFVPQNAGAGGQGGASYIDEVVLRDRDTDGNGSLDERVWYCQNWRYDVIALVDDGGDQREMVRYSAYGVPFGLPGGDCDSDGDCDNGDSVDTDQIQTWINSSSYNLRGDLDLDGDVSSSDKALAAAVPFSGALGGWGGGSALAENSLGFEGLRRGTSGIWDVRHRWLDSGLGAWSSRDPLGYADGAALYRVLQSRPLIAVDPLGLACNDSSWFEYPVISALGVNIGTIKIEAQITSHLCACLIGAPTAVADTPTGLGWAPQWYECRVTGFYSYSIPCPQLALFDYNGPCAPCFGQAMDIKWACKPKLQWSDLIPPNTPVLGPLLPPLDRLVPTNTTIASSTTLCTGCPICSTPSYPPVNMNACDFMP